MGAALTGALPFVRQRLQSRWQPGIPRGRTVPSSVGEASAAPSSAPTYDTEDLVTPREPAPSRGEWGEPCGGPVSWMRTGSSRHALIVCISRYDELVDLPSASADAAVAASCFEALGFEVTSLSGEGRMDSNSLREGVRNFIDVLEQESTGVHPVAMIVVSCHGVQAGGQLHMLPSDARICDEDYCDNGYCEEELKDALDSITPSLPDQRRLQIVLVFDCCRTTAHSTLYTKKNEVTPSLRTHDFFMLYSCDPGRECYDDEEGGVLMQTFLRRLRSPQALSTILAMTAADVQARGQRLQRPWVSTRGPRSKEADSRLEGWLAPEVNPKPEPEVFHASTGTGGSLQPVMSGWERLLPFERQDLEAMENWKSVTFEERHTHRKIQDMLQADTKALPMLLHWGMDLPAEVEVRVNGYNADFRAKFQEAVRFVRRFRLQEYPAEWVPGDDRAYAVGVARQRVVVKGGEEGITLPSVNYLDWALNHLILAILGRDQKGRKPELILLDGTSDGESGAGPGSGSGSYDHFASSSCGMQKEHLHLPLRLPRPDGSESEPSTLDRRIDSQGDGTHPASSSFCSSSGSGNSSNRSNSSSSGGGGSAMKNPSLSLVCSTTLGSNARCCRVAMNCILEAMAKCVLTAADQRRDEASSATTSGKRPELVVLVADPPMPVMMGRAQGSEDESDNDPIAGTEGEAAASLFPPTPWSSEEEQQEAAVSLFPPTPWSSEEEQQEVPFLLDVYLPQDDEHG